jgi:hypothetical protein
MLVGTTTAEISAHPPPNFIGRGIGIITKQPFHSHDLTWSAVATLKGIVFQKSLLNGSEFLSFHEALNGGDFLSLGLHGKSQTGITRLAVHKHCTGATLSPLTTHLCAGEPKFFTEDEEQRPAWLYNNPMAPSVNSESDSGHLRGFQNLRRCLSGRSTSSRRSHRAGSHELEKTATGYPLSRTILFIFLLSHDFLLFSDRLAFMVFNLEKKIE